MRDVRGSRTEIPEFGSSYKLKVYVMVRSQSYELVQTCYVKVYAIHVRLAKACGRKEYLWDLRLMESTLDV